MGTPELRPPDRTDEVPSLCYGGQVGVTTADRLNLDSLRRRWEPLSKARMKGAVRPVLERIKEGVPAKKGTCDRIMNYVYFITLMRRL
jgi:hypothetical protein